MIVPEPRFYLKETTIDAPTLISMQVKYEGQRVFISTGNKVHPSNWDQRIQRVKVSRKNLGDAEINIWLDKMSSEFKSLFRNMMIEGLFPEPKEITRRLLESLNLIEKVMPVKPATLFEFINQFIVDSSASKSLSTIKAYKATLVHMKAFESLLAREIGFDDITIEWRSQFLKYLQALGLGKNTEGKHIKIVKVFMREATERGLNLNLDFKLRSFSKPYEDLPKVFLNPAEISKINSLDLSGNVLQEIVRDYFVIGCMTSLRYSDLVDIRPENIKDGKLHIKTKKTGQVVVIPISSIVKEVLEKYDYQLPIAPCNQVFNRTLKEVCRLAELNEQILITKTVGGVRKTITYSKYELITTHTGRRSMISNGVLAGINSTQLMMISGHRSANVFNRYFKASPQQNAESLMDHKFFE